MQCGREPVALHWRVVKLLPNDGADPHKVPRHADVGDGVEEIVVDPEALVDDKTGTATPSPKVLAGERGPPQPVVEISGNCFNRNCLDIF